MAGLLTDTYTFETFRQTIGNRFAYAASVAVASNPDGTVYNPLVLYGKSCSGKTHLLYAIKHKIEADYPEKKIGLVSTIDFIQLLISDIKNNNKEGTDNYLKYDILLIDDFSYVCGKLATQEAVGERVMSFIMSGKQIVIAHTGNIKDVPCFEKTVRKSIPTALFCNI